MDPGTPLLSARITALIAALVLNALLGGPLKLHRLLRLDAPGRALTHALHLLERKLNREQRSPAERRQRGMLLTITVVALSAALGFFLLAAAQVFYLGGLLDIAVLACLLKLRQTADAATRVSRLLAEGETEKAREELRMCGWRNAVLLDAHGMARAGIETVAVAWCERIVSPALWYLLLDMPGLLACAALTLLARLSATAQDSFGGPQQQAARWMHALPSLVSSLLLAAAALFLPFGRPLAAAVAWIHALPWAHWRYRQAAVMGAALNVSLGGPASVHAQGGWLGGSVARAYPRELMRSVLLLWVSALLLVVMLGMLLMP